MVPFTVPSLPHKTLTELRTQPPKLSKMPKEEKDAVDGERNKPKVPKSTVFCGLFGFKTAWNLTQDRIHNKSGQIIATSHDRFPPKGSVLEGKSPAISGKSRLVKYYFIWPDKSISDLMNISWVWGFSQDAILTTRTRYIKM